MTNNNLSMAASQHVHNQQYDRKLEKRHGPVLTALGPSPFVVNVFWFSCICAGHVIVISAIPSACNYIVTDYLFSCYHVYTGYLQLHLQQTMFLRYIMLHLPRSFSI